MEEAGARSPSSSRKGEEEEKQEQQQVLIQGQGTMVARGSILSFGSLSTTTTTITTTSSSSSASSSYDPFATESDSDDDDTRSTTTTTTTAPTRHSTCFWVHGIGFQVETAALHSLHEGTHFWAVLAATPMKGLPHDHHHHHNSNNDHDDDQPTMVAHVTVPHSEEDAADEEEEGAVLTSSSVRFLWIIFDFLARAHAAQLQKVVVPRLNVWPLPCPYDAVRLDALQDFLFCGMIKRSPLVLGDNDDGRGGAPWLAEIALMPPFIQWDMEEEEKDMMEGGRKKRPKRTRRAHELEASALPHAERMCFDPLWVAVVRHYQGVGVPMPHAELEQLMRQQQCRPIDRASSSGGSRMGFAPFFQEGQLVHHALEGLRQKYELPWPGLLPCLAHSAKLVTVPRGVEVRVVTRRLEDLPHHRSGEDGKRRWQVGDRHVVHFRRVLPFAVDQEQYPDVEEKEEGEAEGKEQKRKKKKQRRTTTTSGSESGSLGWLVL
jgi:hypothetical protein